MAIKMTGIYFSSPYDLSGRLLGARFMQRISGKFGSVSAARTTAIIKQLQLNKFNCITGLRNDKSVLQKLISKFDDYIKYYHFKKPVQINDDCLFSLNISVFKSDEFRMPFLARNLHDR